MCLGDGVSSSQEADTIVEQVSCLAFCLHGLKGSSLVPELPDPSLLAVPLPRLVSSRLLSLQLFGHSNQSTQLHGAGWLAGYFIFVTSVDLQTSL